MGLKDRIEEEMVVDTESILDDNFDRAKELFQIFEDGTLGIKEDYQDVHAKERILIYFIGRQYTAETERAETSTLANGYFYERIGKDDSTIRHYLGDLEDEGLVRKDEESSERELVVENLPKSLDRVEEAGESE